MQSCPFLPIVSKLNLIENGSGGTHRRKKRVQIPPRPHSETHTNEIKPLRANKYISAEFHM